MGLSHGIRDDHVEANEQHPEPKYDSTIGSFIYGWIAPKIEPIVLGQGVLEL